MWLVCLFCYRCLIKRRYLWIANFCPLLDGEMIYSVFFQICSPRLGFLQSTNKSTEEHKVNYRTSATAWGENKFLCPAPHDDSHNWHSRATATHQPLHEAFWNMSVLQTISWKHLKPQENVLRIQVPLHVTCVLRQANSLIPPQARPELWSQLLAMLCGLFKVSRRADTICNSSVFPTQTTPAVFLGLSSFSAAVSFSKMLKSLKMSHHHCSECSTFLCVQKTRSGYVQGNKKYTSDLWGQYSPCIQLWIPAGILWGIPGMSKRGRKGGTLYSLESWLILM